MYRVRHAGSTITLPGNPAEAAKGLLAHGFSRAFPIANGVVMRNEETWTITGGNTGPVLRAMAVQLVRWQRANVPELPEIPQQVLDELPAAPEWRLVIGADRAPFLSADGWSTGIAPLAPDPHRPAQPLYKGDPPRGLVEALNVVTDNGYGLALTNWRDYELTPGLHYALWVSTRVAKEVEGVSLEAAIMVPVYYNDMNGTGGPALETVVMFHS